MFRRISQASCLPAQTSDGKAFLKRCKGGTICCDNAAVGPKRPGSLSQVTLHRAVDLGHFAHGMVTMTLPWEMSR